MQESTSETRAAAVDHKERHLAVVMDKNPHVNRSGRMIMTPNEELLDEGRMMGIVALIEGGLPTKSAFSKMGINKYSMKEILRVGQTFREYYELNPTKYEAKLGANTEKAQHFIMNCIRIFMKLDECTATYESTLVDKVNEAIDANPEIALKVLARRFPDEWGDKKQIKTETKKRIEIHTIRINAPPDDEGEVLDADFEVIDGAS